MFGTIQVTLTYWSHDLHKLAKRRLTFFTIYKRESNLHFALMKILKLVAKKIRRDYILLRGCTFILRKPSPLKFLYVSDK